ncbi:hypothetical protein Tco_1234475 [Tanacetum coccineum]
MERFENAIFKQREEINDRMAEMFRLLKELTTSRALERISHKKTKNQAKKQQNRTRDGKVCEDEAQSKSSQLREEKAKKNIT